MARQTTVDRITPMPSIYVSDKAISRYVRNVSELAPSLQSACNKMVARIARNGYLLVNGSDITKRADILKEISKGSEYFHIHPTTGRVECMLNDYERTPTNEILHIYPSVLTAVGLGRPLVLGSEVDTIRSRNSSFFERRLFLNSSDHYTKDSYGAVLIGKDYSETSPKSVFERLKDLFRSE